MFRTTPGMFCVQQVFAFRITIIFGCQFRLFAKTQQSTVRTAVGALRPKALKGDLGIDPSSILGACVTLGHVLPRVQFPP